MIKALFTLVACVAAAPAKQATLAAACKEQPLVKLVNLAKATNAIFALGVNEENSRRLRRHHNGAEMHQHVLHFMDKTHHQLSRTLIDLEAIAPLSEHAVQIERAVRFMSEIIESNYVLSNKHHNQKKIVNVDLVEERALLSLKRITETFLTIAAQCNL